MATTIPQIADAMRYILTAVATATARRRGFVQRASKLTGPLFAQTLVFGWWTNPAATLADLTETAELLGCDLSPQALHDRCAPAAARFRAGLLHATLAPVVPADPVALPLLRRVTQVWVTDSTLIPRPAALATEWSGCGNSAGLTAARKGLVRWDLRAGGFAPIPCGSGRTHERTAARSLPPLVAGALHLGDLGFFDLNHYAAWRATGVDWLSRLLGHTGSYQPAGQRIDDGVAWLTTQTAAREDYAVLLGVEHPVPARLVGARVPTAGAAARRAARAKEAHRRPPPVSAEAGVGAAGNRYGTNAPAELLSGGAGLVWAPMRWQVEVLVKRGKSLGQVDEGRSTQPWRILCAVYAKLIGGVLPHWLTGVGGGANADRSLRQATQAVQRAGSRVASAGTQPGRGDAVLGTRPRRGRRRCRIHTPANRPATYQLLLNPSRRDQRRPSIRAVAP